jgi:hypothetical protein
MMDSLRRKQNRMGLVMAIVGVLVWCPRSSAAQTPAHGSQAPAPRVFFDVNLGGIASSWSKERKFTAFSTAFGETATSQVSYPRPSRSNFPLAIAGSVMVWGPIAAGVNYSPTSFHDAADMDVTVPHPVILNDFGHVTSQTTSLARAESATHVFVAIHPVRTARIDWRVFFGPSYFSFSADMVREIAYAQEVALPSALNTVTISTFTSERVSEHAVGLHAGTDVAFLLNRHLALTGGIQISDAIVTIPVEPLSQLTQKFRIGGTRLFAGVRVRVGR